MKFRRLLQKARLIDAFTRAYRRERKRNTFPHKPVRILVELLFPSWKREGRGAHKHVYKVTSTRRQLVLKVGRRRSIIRDIKAYRRIPASERNQLFAKIYWHTHHCLLQKYGEKPKVSRVELKRLRSDAKRYGLRDVRLANVRNVGGALRIVDASPA